MLYSYKYSGTSYTLTPKTHPTLYLLLSSVFIQPFTSIETHQNQTHGPMIDHNTMGTTAKDLFTTATGRCCGVCATRTISQHTKVDVEGSAGNLMAHELSAERYTQNMLYIQNIHNIPTKQTTYSVFSR